MGAASWPIEIRIEIGIEIGIGIGELELENWRMGQADGRRASVA